MSSIVQSGSENLDSSIDNVSVESENEDLHRQLTAQYGKILDKLIEMQRIDQAEVLVNSLKAPNTIIYTILMKAYVKAKDTEKAQALMAKMEASTDHQPCLVTYNTFLQCAFEAGDYTLAKQIFGTIKQKDIFSYSIQILFLLKRGLIKDAMKAYSDLLSSNVQLDQIFFNILINGLMKQKQYQVALEVFQTMESRGYHYNEYTVSVIIQLFSYLGKQQEALDLYKLYNYDSIFVNSCLIKMYIHWRNYERIIEVLNDIKKKDQVICSQVIKVLLQNNKYS